VAVIRYGGVLRVVGAAAGRWRGWTRFLAAWALEVEVQACWMRLRERSSTSAYLKAGSNPRGAHHSAAQVLQLTHISAPSAPRTPALGVGGGRP
jgi:hypothetical protein